MPQTQEDTLYIKPTSSEFGRIAAFDFDGTCIDGNSPVALVFTLARKRMLKKRVIALILWWAAKYKLRLPQDESWVREQVFTSFNGRKVDEVDHYLSEFYDKEIDKRFRPEADRTMQAHIDKGDTVIVVSASFEPIIIRAMDSHPFDAQISTRMRIADNGTYTNKVDGAPVEGTEKLARIQQFGDENFGKGNWSLVAAYGDHHSDIPMLRASEEAYAVNPDTTLKREAVKNHWHILEW